MFNDAAIEKQCNTRRKCGEAQQESNRRQQEASAPKQDRSDSQHCAGGPQRAQRLPLPSAPVVDPATEGAAVVVTAQASDIEHQDGPNQTAADVDRPCEEEET